MKIKHAVTTHWKTSLAGLAIIGAAIFHMHYTTLPGFANWKDHVHLWGHDYLLIVVGIGLVFAKDHDKQ